MKLKEIKKSIESDISLFVEIVNKSNSYADLCKYYSLSNNGKQHKYLRELIIENNISITHWDWRKKIRKYKVIEKECPVCKNKFTAQFGNEREKTTCSHKCSNIYFSNKRNTRESSKKRSDSIKKYYLSIGIEPIEKIKCLFCGNEKIPSHRGQLFCSNKCSSKYINKNPKVREKQRQSLLKCVAEGRHKGWNRHTIGQTPSYAEKFFMKVLVDYNISYEYDKKIGVFYVDFAIENKKIALEIDGRQHKQKDLIVRDKRKDAYLSSIGWKVYRIEWNCINKDEGKKLMKEKIQKFLEFYGDVDESEIAEALGLEP